MERRKLTFRIWLPIAVLMVGLMALVAGPMAVGWRCYELHAHGERAATRVVDKTAEVRLVLRITSGPRSGHHCNASTSPAHFAEAQPGDVLEVVLTEGQPDECVLVATLENSAALLWATAGAVAALLLVFVLIGLFLQRSFTEPGVPTTRFDLASGGMACPRCGAPMGEGYLVTSQGIHWRDVGQPIALPSALGGLPGTFEWRKRARPHAYRCGKCEIVTFQYGRR